MKISELLMLEWVVIIDVKINWKIYLEKTINAEKLRVSS
jgi:hypothetical protein